VGWSIRKSFRVLPGVRINLSKSGPRVSVGLPGARASVDMSGKTRLYSGIGPLRYQKRVNLGSTTEADKPSGGLWESVKRMLNGR
jgi:Protein of unknown function (DUF4236)